MEELYQQFKDVAEFRMVYIREAHPTDGRRPSRQETRNEITQPVEHVERCKVAELMVKEGKLNIPCIIDTMDNKVDTAYSAKPDRAFLVGVDGKLAVAGGRGPRGFQPALEDIRNWLVRFELGILDDVESSKDSDAKSADSDGAKSKSTDSKTEAKSEGSDVKKSTSGSDSKTVESAGK